MNNKIKLIKLKKIKNSKGFIVKSISKFDKYFRGFEELYFSTVKKNNIKGWNYHKKMTCNIIVIKGMIEFTFYDPIKKTNINKYKKINLKDDFTYKLLIPPKIWFCFKGKKKGDNILLNFSNKLHNQNEILKKEFNLNNEVFI